MCAFVVIALNGNEKPVWALKHITNKSYGVFGVCLWSHVLCVAMPIQYEMCRMFYLMNIQTRRNSTPKALIWDAYIMVLFWPRQLGFDTRFRPIFVMLFISLLTSSGILTKYMVTVNKKTWAKPVVFIFQMFHFRVIKILIRICFIYFVVVAQNESVLLRFSLYTYEIYTANNVNP